MAGRIRRCRSSVLVLLLALTSLLAACDVESENASIPVVGPSQTSAPSPAASVIASAPAGPTESAPSTTGPSGAVDLAAAEAYLLHGIRADAAADCNPRREDLPARAIAGVECNVNEPASMRVGFYLFTTQSDLLASYFERLEAEGIGIGSGGCFGAAEGDTNYVPEAIEKAGPHRHACFINEAGQANYRATLPDARVYVGVLGASADMEALRRWAWLGNLDTPGGPTIWRNGGTR